MTFVLSVYPLVGRRPPEEAQRILRGASELPESEPWEVAWLSAGWGELPWASALGARREVMVTTMPRVVAEFRSGAGIAAHDADDRARGLAAVSELRDAVAALHDSVGRRVVRGVMIHAAPRRETWSGEALEASLAEIASWDWQGADLMLEHVDALMPSHEPAKGFGVLEAEIAAIRASGVPIRIALNWGRSAIELRDGELVRNHVDEVRDAGLLAGMMFSGVSSDTTGWGAPFADGHLPSELTEPASMLSTSRIEAAVEATRGEGFLGVKMTWPHLEADAALAALGAEIDQVRAIAAASGRPAR